MSRQTYKVGQVLFILKNDEASIVPVQISEEITKKTLQGNEIAYNVLCPVKGKDHQTFDLSSLKGEIFTSADDLKKILIKRVTRSLSDVVARAEEQAKLAFTLKHEKNDDVQVAVEPRQNKLCPDCQGGDPYCSLCGGSGSMSIQQDSAKLENDYVNVTMPDGTKARVKL